MDHFIDQIDIRNFKSIREMTVSGFKRINLFIGRPNVGKSNILEALSLFSLPYIWEGSKKLTDIVRLQSLLEAFYEGSYERGIYLGIGSVARILNCNIGFDRISGGLEVWLEEDISQMITSKLTDKNAYYDVDTDAVLIGCRNEEGYVSNLRPYSFKSNVGYSSKKSFFLQPPFGTNLLYVLELHPDLRQTYAQWFRQYGLRLVLDTASQSLKVQKEKGEDEVFQLPYSSVADTLQRIIFYKTAVASNENSVLLFEEPEAHAYPPYISEFTREVVKSTTNQFFIVTHSPLIVEQFLTDAIDDLGIFMVDFKDGQTVVKGLTTDEIREVYRYGMDLFFNGDSYLV